MELLREGAKVLGLTLSAERLAAFERYYQELETWNRRFNLTAITDYAEVQCRHFLDSLSCLLAFPRREDGGEMVSTSISPQLAHRQLCLDVGSGAGFPGLPVKIVVLNNSSLNFVELEMKAAGFVNYATDLENPDLAGVANALGIKGIRVERSKDLPGSMREIFDHNGPALLDVVTEREELTIPPSIKAEQVKGFTLYAVKTVFSGRGDELLDLARANFRQLF